MILGEVQMFASPEEALEHFGIKGMRWGFRKEESTSEKPSPQTSIVGGGLGHGNPNFELHNPNSLSIDMSKGYSDIRPAGGFANPQVALRHSAMITTLDEMRKTYPNVAAMKIEVVPMSRVPGQENSVHGSFAAVQHIKPGEVRLMYNDYLGALQPHQEAFLKNWMPGIETKNYLGYHEMGHLLATAHGIQPATFDIVNRGRRKEYSQYHKENQKNHEAMLNRHGLSFRELSRLSDYAATEPSEALAELSGHYHSPEMRRRLDPETRAKAKSLFDELGGN